MRVASWVVVVCALVGAAGMFLPSVELQVGGTSFGRRTSLSLYQAHSDREFVRRFVASYGKSSGRRTGEALAAVLLPHAWGRTKGHIDDAHSAMTTLDEVGDDDIKTVYRILTIAIWAFLTLQTIIAALVFGEMTDGTRRRGRLIAALVMSIVVTAVGVAIHLICREAVWQANDNLGYDAIGLAVGAYLIPIAAIGGSIAMVVLLVRSRKLAL